MVKHCIAFGCTNRSSKEECSGLSWHILPLSNKELLETWLVKIHRVNTPVSKNSYVCSKHFEPECFTKPLGGQRIRLKAGSVPTKFVFTAEKQQRKRPCYRATTTTSSHSSKKRAVKSLNMTVDSDVDIPETNNVDMEQFLENEVSDLSENEKYVRDVKIKEEEMTRLQEEWRVTENKLKSQIKELETLLEEERNARKELEILNRQRAFSIETVKDNDKLLRFYTGFENFEMFLMVLNFLGKEAANTLDYKNTERSDSNTKNININKPGRSRTLSVETEFFMVLCRLKVGLLEEDLSTRFGVSQSHVSKIITTWIKFMYFRFKELDHFPSREIVQLHKPECFAKKYSTTTLIIDATEIYIEKPNNPEAQQLTFSSYKNTNTLKALIGIVPKGGISFISTLYGGSISDKEITEKSGLIDKLQHGDAIMADRGFNIQEMLASKGVRVNVPPFMNQTGQFDEHELLETRRIATLRIHVERAMERIKNYHILDFIPITLCKNGVIDMIFFVCAMLTNFLPPLVDG